MSNSIPDQPYQLSKLDRLWYALGAAASVMIVVLLWINSFGKEHPMARTNNSLNEAKQSLNEAMEEKDSAMSNVSDLMRDMKKIEQEAMESSRRP